MIILSNGSKLEYVAASGALAYDGQGWPYDWPFILLGLIDVTLFTRVTKTVTLQPIQGNYRWWNPLHCVRFVKDGVVNAFGLSNPGFDWFEKAVARRASETDRLICSIAGHQSELTMMAKKLNEYPFIATEVDSSCPNAHLESFFSYKDLIYGYEAIRHVAPSRPLIVKLSPAHDLAQIVPHLRGLVDAISINSVPWSLYAKDTGEVSPLAHLGGGGVSGKAAQPWTWKMVEELAGMTDIPIIGPSVWKFDDLMKLRGLGASAFSFGSLFMRYPWAPTRIVRRELEEIESI